MSDKKTPSWLFHPNKPAQIYHLTADEYEAMLKDGYVDSPAKLPAKEQAKEPEKDPGPKELSKEAEKLLAVFVVNPRDLSKDQLIDLAKAFDLRATKNMGEPTIAKAIQDYLDGNSQNAD
ncbi:hypothetical protein [Arsukibacterium sp.]|uniref:hypothetical protein n=1 Tax=Arsukibacterium sp. TaxID=1977258 RepID=UPI002FD94FE3